MNGRKHVTGAVALAILVFLATAAPSAFAEDMAYECSSSAATKTFGDAHCLSGGGSFGHREIAETIEVTGTSEKTASGTTAAAPLNLKGALSGISTQVRCPGTHNQGYIHPIVPWINFTMGKWKWTSCVVITPAEKGCVVSGGTIETNELLATTQGQAANKVKVSPKSGTEIASVKIEKCSVGALNNTFPLTGTYIADTGGATVSNTHAGVTAQNTLKFGGVKAGLESALTFSTSKESAVTFT